MLCPIKHIHVPANRLCRQNVRVLWHVSGSVDLPIVVNALDDLDPGGRSRGRGMGADLAGGVVVFGEAGGVCSGGGGRRGRLGFGDLDLGDDEVVLGLARGMGAEEDAVEGVVGVRRAGRKR
jgi:hypothetical protein